ncbi:MAG: transposase [Ruminococcus sp.]|nr:transposase [Ruminococcus sp.]
MRNCQVRINMNYDVYIEENESVKMLSDIINEIYCKKEYTVTSEWNGEIPEDVLMRVLIYGCMNGAYSSRKIEQLCKRDIHFLWLPDGFKSPDHCMIARFRKKMGSQIEKVFYSLIKYLLGRDEISGKNLFIDGTKIEVNANRYTLVWKKAVSKNEQKLRAKLPAILEEIHSSYSVKFPENTPVDTMIETLSSMMKKLDIERISGNGHHKSVYQKSLEKLEEYRDKMQQYELYNSLFDGRNSFSKTDTDAAFMRMKDDHMKNGQLKPGYNIQAAVEGEYIVGIDISSERSDVNTLRTCLHKISVRIFEHDFVDDKAKSRRNTCRISRLFNEVSGKICRKDVRCIL